MPMAPAAMLQNTRVSPSWPTNVEPTSRAHRCFSLVRSLTSTTTQALMVCPTMKPGEPRDDQLRVRRARRSRSGLVGCRSRRPAGRSVTQNVSAARTFIANADVDRPPGGLEPVHLRQHVADHVGQREDDEAAVGDQRPSPMIGPKATPLVAVTLEMITSAVKTATSVG